MSTQNERLTEGELERRLAFEQLRRGVDRETIARKFHTSRRTVDRWAQLAGVTKAPRSKEVRERAIQQYKEGIPLRFIAKEAGVSTENVRKWCRAAGVPPRTPVLKTDENVDLLGDIIEGNLLREGKRNVRAAAAELGIATRTAYHWLKD